MKISIRMNTFHRMRLALALTSTSSFTTTLALIKALIIIRYKKFILDFFDLKI